MWSTAIACVPYTDLYMLKMPNLQAFKYIAEPFLNYQGLNYSRGSWNHHTIYSFAIPKTYISTNDMKLDYSATMLVLKGFNFQKLFEDYKQHVISYLLSIIAIYNLLLQNDIIWASSFKLLSPMNQIQRYFIRQFLLLLDKTKECSNMHLLCSHPFTIKYSVPSTQCHLLRTAALTERASFIHLSIIALIHLKPLCEALWNNEYIYKSYITKWVFEAVHLS